MTITTPPRTRLPLVLIIVAAIAGALMGTFEIANTSIGWHLAGGRWVIEHSSVPRTDPFSFTSNSREWVDHEWLFQTGAALIHRWGGAEGLSIARALAIAALAVLLLVIGHRSGLSPPAALLLSVACVAGARPRFFLRPELVTLLIVPAAVWLFSIRDTRKARYWLVPLAALMVVGANAHGAVLVVPILLTGMLTAELVEMGALGRWNSRRVLSGIVGIVTTTGALLINPYGIRLFAVPFRLAALVDEPHIPNPEWIPPAFQTVPAFFAVVVLSTLVLALQERRAERWGLFVMALALAMRHIRNLGLFYVLLPLAVAPSLARWRPLVAESEDPKARFRTRMLAVAAALILAVSIAVSPWPRFGLGYADDYYPTAACDFMDGEDLPDRELYNDVLFGGYLIDRYGPGRKIFQDDRNEIHDHLLLEIWEIFGRSDVPAWSDFLAGHRADTALVRYHPPIMVTTPDGAPLGERGFSALWFPRREWALVYWDEIAMVLVRRTSAREDLLANHEYPAFRPDDLTHVLSRAETDTEFAALVDTDIERALRENPANTLALRIARYLEGNAATGL